MAPKFLEYRDRTGRTINYRVTFIYTLVMLAVVILILIKELA